MALKDTFDKMSDTAGTVKDILWPSKADWGLKSIYVAVYALAVATVATAIPLAEGVIKCANETTPSRECSALSGSMDRMQGETRKAGAMIILPP